MFLFSPVALANEENDPEKALVFIQEKYQFIALCKVEKHKERSEGSVFAVFRPIEVIQGNVEKIPASKFLKGQQVLEMYEGKTVIYALEKSDNPALSGGFFAPVNKNDNKKKADFEFKGGLRVTLEDLRKLKQKRVAN